MTEAIIKDRAYRFVGTTDEVTSCGCCGRTGLKGTIVLVERDGGEFVFFGSVCGSKAMGWTVAAVERTAKDADKARKAERERARRAHPLTEQIEREIAECNAVIPRMSFSDRKPHMARWQEMGAQIRAELDAQFAIPAGA